MPSQYRTQPVRRRRLNPVVAAVGNIALQGAKYAAKKYGPKFALGAATAGAGYAGYKAFGKGTTGKKAVVKRLDKPAVSKQVVGTQGGYEQHEYIYKQSGRKTNIANVANLLQKKNLDTLVYSFKKLDLFGGGFGQFDVAHRYDATTERRYMPLYLLDLTQLPGSGPGCMYRAYMHHTGANDGKIGWVEQNGYDGSGVLSPLPFIKYSTNNDLSAFHDKRHYGLMTIKLNLYGMTTRHTTFKVSLVQFKSDDYTPTDDMGSVLTTVTNELGTNFWQPRIRKLTANPIADTQSLRASDMKVVKSETFEIGPVATTEADTSPHHVTISWKHYYNKLVASRKTQTVFTDDDNVIDPKKTDVDIISVPAGKSYTPLAKDRLYLMIEATSWVGTYTTVPADATNAPSFDINTSVTCRVDGN